MEADIAGVVARVTEGLRDELHQYGEMLALLDQQQEAVMGRAADEVMKSVVAIHEHLAAIGISRGRRASEQADLARALGQPEETAFVVLIPLLTGGRGAAVEALVTENNRLLARVRRRAQQNHLLLARSVELMRQFMNALAPAPAPRTYNDGGRLAAGDQPAQMLYEAVG